MLRTSASSTVSRASRQYGMSQGFRLPSSPAVRHLGTSPTWAASYRRFGEPHRSEARETVGNQLSGNDSIRKQLQEQLFRSPSSSTRSAGQAIYQRFGGGGGGGRGGGSSRFGNRPPIILVVALGGAGVYYVAHLEKVPETGRWRFMDVSPEAEHQLGDQTFRQTLAQYKGQILPASHPYSKQVRAVASRIVAALNKAVENQPHHTRGDSGLDHHSHGQEGGIKYGSSTSDARSPNSSPSTQWEVFVIDDPKQKNAFVLPGGKIFVFTGILPVCQNADGLATVLGHEIAHQVARHSAEKMSNYKVLFVGAFVLELLGLDIGISRIAINLLLSLPNSRKTELEADYLGLRIMSRACFDPSEASKLWTRMSESEGGSKGGILSSAEAILSTHPVSSQRIKNMEKWLPEAISTRESSGCPPSQQVNAFKGAMGYTGTPSPF